MNHFLIRLRISQSGLRMAAKPWGLQQEQKKSAEELGSIQQKVREIGSEGLSGYNFYIQYVIIIYCRSPASSVFVRYRTTSNTRNNSKALLGLIPRRRRPFARVEGAARPLFELALRAAESRRAAAGCAAYGRRFRISDEPPFD